MGWRHPKNYISSHLPDYPPNLPDWLSSSLTCRDEKVKWEVAKLNVLYVSAHFCFYQAFYHTHETRPMPTIKKEYETYLYFTTDLFEKSGPGRDKFTVQVEDLGEDLRASIIVAMPSNERTPLITTVVVGTQRQRYAHSTLRRFCTIALTSSFVIVLLLFLLPIDLLPSSQQHKDSNSLDKYLPWSSPYPHESWPQSQGLSYEHLQQVLLQTPIEEKAREWSQYYAAGPHLAGKNLSQALWTRERWQEWGVSASIATYDVYINYPVGHRLALLQKNLSSTLDPYTKDGEDVYEVQYECSLEEDVLEEDSTTGLENRVPTFHGYSANGNVTAQYVYVNFGTYEDFEDLVKANISLEGKIALVKYGGIFRGLKVKRAQELGMIGTVIYTDPQEDGMLPGDPTTPGYPSKPGVPREDPSYSTPQIPSLPISYQDALPLLKALNGHGPKASDFNEFWQGGGLGYKGVEYNIGPSAGNVVLNLVNEQEYTTTPLWNVIGIINGTIADEVVVIGNHRDAWIAGGAGDPNSGSSILNEVIRSFGAALDQGWKPLRTIVFASWDGEEYALIGSTEWVEEYIPWLSHAAIAYLNVDIGTRGPRFTSAASPLLNKSIYEATSLVLSPNQTTPGQTIRDLWDGHIRTMGSGSDFTAFQDFAGIPSTDFGFGGSHNDPVYHYHSNFDSSYWMDKYGDPGFHYHIAMTKLCGLFIASLVESPIIAFNATDYALGLATYLQSVVTLANASKHDSIRSISFTPLTHAVAALRTATAAFDARAESLSQQIQQGVPWWKWWQKAKLYYEVQTVNAKYKYLERQFLHPEGLDGRSWFKHVVFAPGLWTGYSGATFPGLVECVQGADGEGVRRWSGIIEGIVRKATGSLG
ncbi:MAG: hypothetical protein Q9195_000837 [Heterodermia aff. obscurata]